MAASLNSSAADLRECAVCLDDMLEKKPKVLECKHSYCMSCLSGLAVVHGTSGLKVPCPKCEFSTYVKSGNLSDLPDNFLLQEVKSVIDNHTRYYYSFYCNKQDQERREVSLCVSCHLYMCGDCLYKHKLAFKKHEIKQIVTEKHKDREYCQKHNETVGYACLDCTPVNLFCDVCIMIDNLCHPLNDLVEYKAALSQVKTNLKSKLEQVRTVELPLSKVEGICNKELSVILETVAVLQDTIETAAAEITSLTEKTYNINSLKLKSARVKQLGQIAEGLLNSDNSKLDELRQTVLKFNAALNSFSDEEKKIKKLELKPDSAAKFRGFLSEIIITQLLLNTTQMEDGAKLMSDGSNLKSSSRQVDEFSMIEVPQWNKIFGYELKENDPGVWKPERRIGERCIGQLLNDVRLCLTGTLENGEEAEVVKSVGDDISHDKGQGLEGKRVNDTEFLPRYSKYGFKGVRNNKWKDNWKGQSGISDTKDRKQMGGSERLVGKQQHSIKGQESGTGKRKDKEWQQGLIVKTLSPHKCPEEKAESQDLNADELKKAGVDWTHTGSGLKSPRKLNKRLQRLIRSEVKQREFLQQEQNIQHQKGKC